MVTLLQSSIQTAAGDLCKLQTSSYQSLCKSLQWEWEKVRLVCELCVHTSMWKAVIMSNKMFILLKKLVIFHHINDKMDTLQMSWADTYDLLHLPMLPHQHPTVQCSKCHTVLSLWLPGIYVYENSILCKTQLKYLLPNTFPWHVGSHLTEPRDFPLSSESLYITSS